ncbi:methionine ABC transporter ATP-binding protein [Aureimonas altamirensis]|uniref:methionine ABC transporter ATP-binding protein n=1 Tax=Aureimonas altamirensis TaxID=370622 RepID=UPI0020373A4D|nr:methionine ABC transporter ATP-binding protein [Aureimonas altamirensis]MCM2502479.1 methionine ABC transporter ATP-binding protein [Aureimonas altamirensis]
MVSAGNPDDPSNARPILRLTGVSKRFGAHAAISEIDLTVGKGEIVGIIGRSGAGKSTLIRCINGLEKPDRGTVEVEGRAIEGLTETGLQPVRRRIGMIFQHFNLLANKTVAENVALPLKIGGHDRAARRRRVAELLDLVGLAGRDGRYPAQLSGGQKQRVGIARALAADPVLLLSDEATSALDPETTEQILRLLADINRRLGLTIALITHEMDVVRRIAGRVVVLDGGRIVESGETWRVFAAPSAPETVALLSSVMPEAPLGDGGALPALAEGETLLRLDLGGENARRPFLSDIALLHGATARILGGGVEDVQGQPVGRLVLGVTPGAAGELPAVIDTLSAYALRVEVIER